MGATPFVIALVALVFPILMLALALLFDLAIVGWAAYHVGRKRFLKLRTEFALAHAHAKLVPR